LVHIDAYVIGKKEANLWELQPVRAREGRKADMTYTEAMGNASSKNGLKKKKKKKHSVSVTDQLSHNHTASPQPLKYPTEQIQTP